MEVWHVGDDGLTMRLSEALENAFDKSLDYTPSNGRKPGTLIVRVPQNVGWKEYGKRTQVRYTVEFMTVDDVSVGRSEGACWEEAVQKCAARVLRDAKRLTHKVKRRADF